MHAFDRWVAVVLAAYVVLGVDSGDGPEHLDAFIAQPIGIGHAGRFSGEQADELQQMVLHNVAQRPDRVVEAAAVLDPEVLCHGDLHAGDPVAIPQWLKDRVGEPQEHDVHGGFFAEEVVDAKDLPLVQMLSQLVIQGAGRVQVVAEGLLDHHPGAGGQVGAGQPIDHWAEQRRRDLQVEHRGVLAVDRFAKVLIGFRVVIVARHHRQPLGEAGKDSFLEGLAAVLDSPARMSPQVFI